jgi:hypothetical protein
LLSSTQKAPRYPAQGFSVIKNRKSALFLARRAELLEDLHRFLIGGDTVGVNGRNLRRERAGSGETTIARRVERLGFDGNGLWRIFDSSTVGVLPETADTTEDRRCGFHTALVHQSQYGMETAPTIPTIQLYSKQKGVTLATPFLPYRDDT